MPKRILVLDGGAQLGAYQWGVLEHFLANGIGPSYFDYYVCTSSGAFNGAYFISQQIEEGRKIWLKYLPELFWKPFSNDMNALGKILRNIEPIDGDKVKNNTQKIIAAVSNTETLRTEYIVLNEQADIAEALLATCGMPLLAKPQELAGKFYYDGAMAGQTQLAKAKELEPDAEIWAILLRPKGYRLGSLFWKFISLFATNSAGRYFLANWPRTRNAFFEQMDNISGIKIIRPKKALPIGYRSKNKKMIAEIYELGKIDAREFLKTL